MSIFSAIGGIAGALMGNSAADKNIKLQKQFAQSGIQWKVEDAKKAGIHPLAALGAQTHSFSPVSIGDPVSSLSNAGQSIDRAIDATSDQSTRNASYDTAIRKLQLERGGLENELLRHQIASQIATTTQAGRSPGIPTSMSANPTLIGHNELPQVPGTVVDGPLNRVGPDSNAPHAEPGAVTDIGYSRTASGGYFPIYGKDIKDRLEEDTLGEIAWAVRNRILPFMHSSYMTPPSNVPLPDSHYWDYTPTGVYQPRRFRKALPPGRYHQYYYE